MNPSDCELKPLAEAPFLAAPETARRLMRTCLGAMVLVSIAATMLFGWRALFLVVIGGFFGLMAEFAVAAIRHTKPPGSSAHSITMGVIVAFTLPSGSPYIAAVIGAIVAVVIGKGLFGGVGRYVWHPALIGRLAVELIFGKRVRLDDPSAALSGFNELRNVNVAVELDRYLVEHLPSVEQCLIGRTGGAIGATCAVAIVLAGLFLLYRGYIRWQLPFTFMVSAYVAAVLCPLPMASDSSGAESWCVPLASQSLAVVFTYANYHVLTGTLLLAAFILCADTTSRPITAGGQVIFAAIAGALSIVLRMYTPVALPACAAVLIMNSFVPGIDRLTRPR